MISVADAIEIVIEATAPLPPEKVSILDAPGRVLAEDIVAPRALPPRDNAAMDGYACRHGDAVEAGRLRVMEAIRAGGDTPRYIGQGDAVKIMTGASVPAGADTVIRIEDVREDGEWVEIVRIPKPGANVRPAGEDVQQGEVIIPVGSRVRPVDAGMLAALGRSFVLVHQKPRVAIISTGDEIVDLDETPDSERIVDANSYALAALVKEAGGEPLRLGVAPDQPCALARMLERAAGADMVLTSGGVSVGDWDHVRPCLSDLGVEVKFAKVAIKPGKPLVFATKGTTSFFGLPGNPVAAAVGFEVFVRPALLRLQGHGNVFRPVLEAELGEEAGLVRSSQGRLEFLRCRVERRGNDLRVVRVMKPGSGLISTLVHANAFLLMPEGAIKAIPGTRVQVQVFDEGSLHLPRWAHLGEEEDRGMCAEGPSAF